MLTIETHGRVAGLNIDDGKGGKTWLFGRPASAPYRANWDIAQWYQKEADTGGFHGKDWVNAPYQSLQNVHNFPEVDDPRMPPGKQAANTYGYIFPNMSHGHLEHGNPIAAQSDMDYRLYQAGYGVLFGHHVNFHPQVRCGGCCYGADTCHHCLVDGTPVLSQESHQILNR